MNISKDDVMYVANLARLNVSDSEADKLTGEMESIIGFADMLGEVDTTDVLPTNHAMNISNVFREDEIKVSYTRDELLSNAPSKMAGCVAVPKVIE